MIVKKTRKAYHLAFAEVKKEAAIYFISKSSSGSISPERLIQAPEKDSDMTLNNIGPYEKEVRKIDFK